MIERHGDTFIVSTKTDNCRRNKSEANTFVVRGLRRVSHIASDSVLNRDHTVTVEGENGTMSVSFAEESEAVALYGELREAMRAEAIRAEIREKPEDTQ